MRRLAAAGDTGERKVLPRIAPGDFALFPRNAQNLGASALHIHHRLCAQIADPGLESDTPVGRDDEEPIESDCASHVTAQRDSNAARFRPTSFRSARNPLVPFELFCTAVERLL